MSNQVHFWKFERGGATRGFPLDDLRRTLSAVGAPIYRERLEPGANEHSWILLSERGTRIAPNGQSYGFGCDDEFFLSLKEDGVHSFTLERPGWRDGLADALFGLMQRHHLVALSTAGEAGYCVATAEALAALREADESACEDDRYVLVQNAAELERGLGMDN